jgi:hypothetical protein
MTDRAMNDPSARESAGRERSSTERHSDHSFMTSDHTTMADAGLTRAHPSGEYSKSHSGSARRDETRSDSASRLSDEQLARVLNTAMIASRGQKDRDFYQELAREMKTPAFRAILTAVRSLAEEQGLSSKDAAEEVIAQFRRIDALWREYVFHEGVEHMRSRAQK